MQNTLNQTQAAGGEQSPLPRYHMRWQLTADGPALRTPSSWLQPVRYRGAPAMLKIAMTAEEGRGARLMTWWDSHGAMGVLRQEDDALLLERATSGRTLADRVRSGDDDQASRIICQVAAKLHQPRITPRPPLIPLAQWFAALTTTDTPHPGLIGHAAGVAARLLATPQEVCVLHGDLHHDNILEAGAQGFLAIDPKGLLGERGFDFANLFCNPDFATATSPGRLARQVAIISREAALEPNRLLAWILSWSALSALWHIEDGGCADSALAVAEIALQALHLSDASPATPPSHPL